MLPLKILAAKKGQTCSCHWQESDPKIVAEAQGVGMLSPNSHPRRLPPASLTGSTMGSRLAAAVVLQAAAAAAAATAAGCRPGSCRAGGPPSRLARPACGRRRGDRRPALPAAAPCRGSRPRPVAEHGTGRHSSPIIFAALAMDLNDKLCQAIVRHAHPAGDQRPATIGMLLSCWPRM